MAMASVIGNCGKAPSDYRAVFIDTNLDTHLALSVSYDDTISDLKRKLPTEHLKCFVQLGEIEVHHLKAKMRENLYFLPDTLPVRSAFDPAELWFLFAEISSQFGHFIAAEQNTKCCPDPRIRMLPSTSFDSSLRKGGEKDERNVLTDNLPGEVRSEIHQQLVADFDIDDHVKCSSSDRRLNILVADIYKASCEAEEVPVLISGTKGLNSSDLLTKVMSVIPSGKSSDVASAENIVPKKKKKVADKDFASKKLAAIENLDQNVDNGVGRAGEIKQEDEGFGINRTGAEIEKTVDPHGEGCKNLESHEKDMQNVTIESEKTKDADTPKKKKKKSGKKRMTKVEVVNGEIFPDLDASVNAFAKSLAVPNDTVVMQEGSKSMCMDVHINDNNAGKPISMDKDETGELEGSKSAPSESGMTKSKKRKKNVDDVSHPMDLKGNDEQVVRDIGSGEVPELGMSRPLKRMKTDDAPGSLSSKQSTKIKKSKRKIKVKQVLAAKNITDWMGDHMDAMEIEKSKPTFSKLAAEKDDNINIESFSSPHKQIDKGFVEATSEADSETKANICVDEEVLITKHHSDIKTQPGADETLHNVPDPMQLTQIQKSEGAEIKKKKSSKKAKEKQNLVVKNISELPVIDENNNMICNERIAAASNLTPEKNDEMELLSSCQEKIDKAVSVADANADIEVRSAKGRVDDKVIVTDHGSDPSHRKEADKTMQNDVESMQLTPIQKSENDNKTRSVKTKKKLKQKQSHQPKRISKFSIKDQGNSITLGMGISTLSRAEAEKGEANSLSSPAEQIDSVTLISASDAAEISAKAKFDEVIFTNHGSDVNMQQAADNACQNGVEPMQLNEVQRSGQNTAKISVQTEKKTKQQKVRTGNNLPKVVNGKGGTKNVISFEKGIEIAPAEVQVPLKAAEKKGSGKASSESQQFQKSTDMVQQAGSKDSSSEKRHNDADPNKFKVEGSSLIGQPVNAEQQDRSNILSTEPFAAADTLKSKNNDSRTSSSNSDTLSKSSHQGKATTKLPKMKNQSTLPKSAKKSTLEAVHNSPSNKRSLISNPMSIFKDESSFKSEDKGGRDAVDSSTGTTDNDYDSSDYSEDESRGSWVSPKQGNSRNGGDSLQSKSMLKNLSLESVFRSSAKFKKAKLVATKLRLLEEESEPVDIVPDSQANTWKYGKFMQATHQ